ncbi:TlpA disulfide reductase family protein [Bacillus infantis]|jgi:peroxiredoxin|uniref:TlpA disulfide reductase family protein n=1 Tax=Bacillus infantis TaxID=324767 RepID=UPI00209ED042|nr:TlpA disulfide reductase family protein [Bacillus infantis]MCP1159159.1 TlpA family protein disulfide reductase [Bacillus infantis]
MKKFLLVTGIILLALFVIDKTVLKDKGVVNKVLPAEKYERLENPEEIAVGIEPGNKAPDFTLTDIEGKTVSLSDYKGKRVFLNFWASWCPPCKAEMPDMQELYEEKTIGDFEILAVNMTFIEKNKGDEMDFVKDNGLTFPIPLDVKGQVMGEYEIMAYPTSFFIDSDGIIRSRVMGAVDKDFIEKESKRLP